MAHAATSQMPASLHGNSGGSPETGQEVSLDFSIIEGNKVNKLGNVVDEKVR